MSRIKGRYVAQVIIDIDIDANQKGILPYEIIRDKINNDLDSNLKDMIQEELFLKGEGTVEVDKQYCNVYQVPDDTEDNG